jgi:NAD(P)-dependent dehydrogenase (short-subunit alcohol dehydrogenase family)
MTIPAMFDLTGRVALVAGGTKGIGEAFVRQYVAHGGRVTIAARDDAACTALAAELNAEAGREVAWGHPFDLGDTASIDRLIDAAVDHWGQLDTLFCCSFFAAGGRAATTSDEDFTKTFRLNVVNWSHAAHRALPALERSDLARVIFVSSASGVRPAPHQAAYGLAKLALTRLAQTLAIEWGPLGVRVNTLTPGMTATPTVKNWLSSEEEVNRRTAEFPIRRLGLPEEIAAGGIFLAAPASGFTTGTELISDGGRTLLSGNTGAAFT